MFFTINQRLTYTPVHTICSKLGSAFIVILLDKIETQILALPLYNIYTMKPLMFKILTFGILILNYIPCSDALGCVKHSFLAITLRLTLTQRGSTC